MSTAIGAALHTRTTVSTNRTQLRTYPNSSRFRAHHYIRHTRRTINSQSQQIIPIILYDATNSVLIIMLNRDTNKRRTCTLHTHARMQYLCNGEFDIDAKLDKHLVCITVGVRASKEAWFGSAHTTSYKGCGVGRTNGCWQWPWLSCQRIWQQHAIRSVAVESIGCCVSFPTCIFFTMCFQPSATMFMHF